MTLFSSTKGAAAGGWMKRHPPYKLKRNPHLDIDENLLELEHEIIEVQLGLGGPL
jgi:hypothetical protein